MELREQPWKIYETLTEDFIDIPKRLPLVRPQQTCLHTTAADVHVYFFS